MTHVLINSYHFPPIGGAGAQRPVRFARHLRNLGFRLTVLTGPADSHGYWTPRDETLGCRLPQDIRVIRVPGPEPTPERWERRVAGWLALKNRATRWWIKGSIATARTCSDVDVIWTVMAPFESAAASAKLAHEMRVPWVADLTDPWALDEMALFPTGLHRRHEVKLMKRVLPTAGAIVMTTPEAVKVIRRVFPSTAEIPTFSIPCGFDADDFRDAPEPRNDDRFRIVHTGYLHTELGLNQRTRRRARRLLGGTHRGVDILARSHVYLLAAVDRLLENRPALANELEIHFAGVLSEADRAVAARSPVTRLRGYVTHADAIALMKSADLLFLPMQKLAAGMRSTMVPGKTYEYLASGRPILAALPPGDARDIVSAAGNARICEPDDTAAIAAAIEGELDRWRAGANARPPSPNVVQNFEARHLASAVAEALESAIARGWSSGP